MCRRPRMPEGLISRLPLRAQISHLMPPTTLRLTIRLTAFKRTPHPLVIIRRLLARAPTPATAVFSLVIVTIPLDAIAPPAAAAGAEQPEEARGEGEGDAEPGGNVDAVAEGAVDVVFVEGGVEGACEGGVEDGGRKAEGDDEERGDARYDCRGQAAQPGEQREEADEDLDYGGYECHDVADEHPFRDGFVGGEAGAELFAEELVDARVVQAPDFDGVEPEFVRVWAAEVDMVADAAGAVGGEVA